MVKKCRFLRIRVRRSLANILTTCTIHGLFPFLLWCIIDKESVYLRFCISRLSAMSFFFFLNIKIYLYQKISANSVTKSKNSPLAIIAVLLQRHIASFFCHATLTSADNTPCRKTSAFYLDLSEMCPSRVIISILYPPKKRPLRYGDYLSNEIQHNKFEQSLLC